MSYPMSKTRIIIFFTAFWVFTTFLQAQYIDGNQEPPGIRWQSLKSDYFEIIFPDEITGEAIRLAGMLDSVAQPMARTLNYKFKRIPLLLTTQGVIANGYVTMAPRYSEWFGTPIMNSSFDEDWYEFLASHELRHVVQFDKLLHRGFNRVIGYLSGEQFIAVWNSLLVPRWFWEGDAVALETAMGRGGRGRHPEFGIGIKTSVLSGERLSYYQAVLGSYSRYSPDPYELGYHLVTHVRRHQGSKVWADALGRTSIFIFYPFAFTASARGVMKRSVPNMYNDAMDELELLWKAQTDGLRITPARTLNRRTNRIPTDYLFPQYLEDGSVVAVKQGYADPPTLIKVNPDGEENQLTQLFYLYSISSRAGRVVWDEPRSDLRWTKQSYSDIALYDINNRQKRLLTEEGKYFSPALSFDGSRVAAVEFTAQRQCYLVIFDSESGAILKRIEHPKKEIIKMPDWSPDGSMIVFANQSSLGKGLSIYHLQGDSISTVMTHSWQGISQPVFYGDYVLFHSFASGLDNIHAVHLKTGKTYQVTSRATGAYNPSVKPEADLLLFNDYNDGGYDIAGMVLDSTKWISQEDIKDSSPRFYEPLIEQEQAKPIFGNGHKIMEDYPIEPYQLSHHLFNYHSWYIQPNTYNPGIYLISKDILNTMSIGSGIYYNINERMPGVEVQAGYGGFFPLISLDLIHRGRETYYATTENKNITDEWWESTAQIGLSVPLVLSSGIWSSHLNSSLSVGFTKISGQTYMETGDLGNGNFLPVSYLIEFSRLRRYALRDVQPVWGQALDLYYYHTPFKGDYTGNLLGGQIKLYLPGFFRHHGFLLSGSLEKQNPGNYQFPSALLFPRGYRYAFHKENISASVNYKMPLFYPDFSLGGLFYLKRVKINVFNDLAWTRDDTRSNRYHSAGFEFMLDHFWFTWPIQIEGGYRLSYLIDKKHGFSELFIRLPLE